MLNSAVSLSKNINPSQVAQSIDCATCPSLVLVQPRKTRPFITERLLMGRKKSNQTNKTKFIMLINVKMPTIVGILTIISMINTTSERLKARNFFICRHFSFYDS